MINRIFLADNKSYKATFALPLLRLFYLLSPIILVILITSCMVGCKKNTDKQKQALAGATIITAESKKPVTKLYYNGVIDPIDSKPVLSPIDATVNQLLFSYGESIIQKQPLIVLSSKQLVDDYRKSVSSYLQTKEDYENTLKSFQGTEVLFKAKVISEQDYSNEKASVDAKTLTYYQAIYDLEKLLAKAGVEPTEIEALSLKNISKVNKVLNRQFGEVKVYAPTTGVALFPLPADNKDKGGSGSGKISVGDELKADQLILSIGNLTGFSVKFNVSEINVNEIKKGLPAKVTGDAFPGMTLKGTVTAVASQANPSTGSEGAGGGLSMFAAEVKIPHLTKKEQQTIHVGMTTKVELDLSGPPTIMLPVDAVFQKMGQNMVTLIDKNSQQKDVPVTTGQTTLKDVEIISGVKAGDKILIKPKKPTPTSTTEK